MTDRVDSTAPAVVAIAGSEVQRITYHGEPVVTFAMVDEIHQRADGTASRNFRDNRDRFSEGEDFVEMTADEIRRQSLTTVFAPRTAKGIVLTRRGYLKLVKPMQDDRAWQVQGEMIDRYFLVEQLAARVVRATSPAMSREARLQFKQCFWLAKQLKLEGNQAILSANRATKVLTGVDMMGLLGMTHTNAPQNEALLTPTQIGERMSLSGRAVNRLLTEEGLQVAFKDRKGNIYYEPTDDGRRAGAVMQDTGKQHSNGTPVRQLKWASRIVDVLGGRVSA